MGLAKTVLVVLAFIATLGLLLLAWVASPIEFRGSQEPADARWWSDLAVLAVIFGGPSGLVQGLVLRFAPDRWWRTLIVALILFFAGLVPLWVALVLTGHWTAEDDWPIPAGDLLINVYGWLLFVAVSGLLALAIGHRWRAAHR